jgi:hypothetical protein
MSRIRIVIVLLLVAMALVWIGITSLHHARTQHGKPITDLGMTMPLNQPGGGLVAPDAYKVYSALYERPLPEMLAIAENSKTDVPQVNGSCLKPATPQEQEMADAFVAANQQSHRWEEKFAIAQGYRLLPSSELRCRLACQSTIAKAISNCGMYGSWAFQGLTTHIHRRWYR